MLSGAMGVSPWCRVYLKKIMKIIKKIKKGFGILIGCLIFFLILGLEGVGAELKPWRVQNTSETGLFVSDEIVVKFKGDNEPFRLIKVPQGKVRAEIKNYLRRSEVEYAEPNYFAHATILPNDEYYHYQWHLDNPTYGGIQTEEAWDISTGSGVTIAVIDTGIAYENYRQGRKQYYQAPDLANSCFVSGYDFVNRDSHPNDDNSHGTHVAGTVAQSTNNAIGVAGVAFKSCLMPLKVLDRNGKGTYSNISSAIRWAADHGAQVINLSLGGSSASKTLEDALAYAYHKGVTIIASAGNESKNTLSYPAAYDAYVIAVGATRWDETLAYYSNYGSSLDLVAPGGDLNVDQNSDGYPDGVLQNTFNPNTKNTKDFGYWFFQGTSMAAPHVSGVAALLIANGNATTPAQIRAVLQETAEDLGTAGPDDSYGYGLVDAQAALSW
jgi:serine protease